jgi:hypothetical protein
MALRLATRGLGSGYQSEERRVIRLSAEGWADFAEEIDRIGVWSWDERYTDESVMDGTHGSIRLHRS